MKARSLFPLLGLTVALSSEALAQTSPAAAPEATKTAAAAEAKTIRRDPAGRTGISPSWEAIKRGDDAYVAHNLEGAIREYQAAIDAKPQNAVAHYRLACALIAKGDFKLAQESLDSSLRFAQTDRETAAKVLFVTADLKERQHDYPAALTAWKAYSEFVKSNANVKGFPKSGEAREAAVSHVIKLNEESAKVKQRIEERLQLLEPGADQKGAKKDESKSKK